MTKQELITILSKSDSPSSKKVEVSVEYPDGTVELLDINTFTICSDRISLNVKSELNTTIDAPDNEPERQIDLELDELDKTEEADGRWMYDYYNSKPHNHFLKKLDCIIYEDSMTHDEKVLFVTSFDYEADCAARGLIQYGSNYRYAAAPRFYKYRFATEEEIFNAVKSLDAKAWTFTGDEFKDKYIKYIQK